MMNSTLFANKQYLGGNALVATPATRSKPSNMRIHYRVSAQINFGETDGQDEQQAQRPLSNPTPRFFAVDGHPPALSEDWRFIRAQLVAREQGGDAGAAAGLGMLVKPTDTWAHALTHPEAGCLLVARGPNLGMFSHSVVLVTEHNDTTGTSALMLNMPTPLYIANLGLEEDITGAFGHRPLCLGGPMTRHLLHVLHGRDDVEGSMCIVDGVYAGGVESASELIRQGRATSDEFCLLAGYSGWGPGQLAHEVAQGSWWVVSASHSLILDCVASSTWDPTQMGLPGTADTKMMCWRKVLDVAGLQEQTR